MKIEAFDNNLVIVTTTVGDVEVKIRAYARKPRLKSDAEIVIAGNPYSKQINDAARACILDFLEEKLSLK